MRKRKRQVVKKLIQCAAIIAAGVTAKVRAQAGKLGYDILLNEREGLFGFYLYKGNDLTATNTEGNTPCIFSRDFDNVNEQEYTASIENCGNFIYVQGAADDDGSQPVTTVDGEGATGLDLIEVFCDATDAEYHRPAV